MIIDMRRETRDERRVAAQRHGERSRTMWCMLMLIACSLQLTAQIGASIITGSGQGSNGGAVGDTSLWELSGSDIYNKNSGNVGVGVVLPLSKFHVVGIASVSNGASAGRINFYEPSGSGTNLIGILAPAISAN